MEGDRESRPRPRSKWNVIENPLHDRCAMGGDRESPPRPSPLLGLLARETDSIAPCPTPLAMPPCDSRVFTTHGVTLYADGGGELHDHLLRPVSFKDPCVLDPDRVVELCWPMRIDVDVLRFARDPDSARVHRCLRRLLTGGLRGSDPTSLDPHDEVHKWTPNPARLQL
jgi:hypothetical protein